MTIPPWTLGGRSLTVTSLLALAAGLGLGIAFHGSGAPAVAAAADTLAPVGQIWVRALQMTVIPLVITHLLAAIVGNDSTATLGTLGAKALLLFVVMLIAGGLFTIAVVPPLVSFYPVSPETAEALRAGVSIPASALEASRGGGTAGSIGDWLVNLIPGNVFAAAAGGEILPLLLFTVVFGLAVTRLPPEPRDMLARIFRALGDAMMVLVRWILVVTPLGVFALAFGMALETGLEAAGFLVVFVVLVSGVMVLFTGFLYPVTAALGRVSLRTFARGVAPAQLVAVSSRSSLASLPALIEGARDHLRLPTSATGFVLPLAVSTYKVNRTISSTTKLLFLGHVFGFPLGPAQLATFLVAALLLSFSSVGVPGGGTAFRTLPAYLAAGAPIEGIVILEAVDAIPDIFKTLTNVTGDMSAAIILSRAERAAATVPPAVPVPAVEAPEATP